MEPFSLYDYFSDFLWARNVNLLTVLFLVFEGILFWVKVQDLDNNIKNLFNYFWPFGLVYLKYLSYAFCENCLHTLSWSFQAFLIVAGSLFITFMVIILMISQIQ
jgi:hypothetical protein